MGGGGVKNIYPELGKSLNLFWAPCLEMVLPVARQAYDDDIGLDPNLNQAVRQRKPILLHNTHVQWSVEKYTASL